MYKARFKAWGLRKYLKGDEALEAWQKHGLERAGDSITVTIGEKKATRAKVRRHVYAQRKKTLMQQLAKTERSVARADSAPVRQPMVSTTVSSPEHNGESIKETNTLTKLLGQRRCLRCSAFSLEVP